MAGDVYKYIVVIIGMSIIFNVAGLPTGIGFVVNDVMGNYLEDPENIAQSAFYTAITAFLAIAAGAGIVAGLFGRSPSESFLMGSYATILISFVSDIIIISTYAFATYSDWVGWTLFAILGPLAGGYIHSIASWWGGKS